MTETGLAGEPVILDEPPAVLSDEELKRQLRIQVVDATQTVHDESADSADEYLRQQTSEAGFKGFIKKVWYGNLARDYVRQRHLMRTSRQIISEQNIYAGSGDTKEEHDMAMAATIERVTSEYSLLHNGETNQEASELEGGQELEQQLRELVSNYASGDINDDTLEVEKDRLLGHFGAKRHEQDRHKGQLLADNVVAVARNARAALSHQRSLAEIDTALGVKVADVRLGVRTAASKELTDRIIDKIYSTKLGSTVNETTIATAAAVAIGASKFTVRKAVSAAGATVGIGVGSAVVAGVRETHHVKQERRLHSRQMAEGGQVDVDNGRRRQQMETTRYQTAASSSLTDSLRQAVEAGSPDRFTSLLTSITETQARIDMSDDLGIDLISYDGKTRIEQQRLELDIALAQAKVALRKLAREDDNVLAGTGLSVDEAIAQSSDLVLNQIEEDISDKNRAFHHLQAKRALASAAIGFTVGAVLGTGSQELRTVFDKGLQGLFEHGDKSANRVTELAGLLHNQQHQVVEQHTNVNFANSSYHAGNNAIDLPKGYHITDKHDLVGPDGKVIASHMELGKDGNLTKESVQELEEKDFKFHVSKEAFEVNQTETTTQEISASDYIASHQEQFTNINRELWYDNNSPYPDQNELATWWGGVNNTGINGQGNFVLNVSHMTPTGSFEAGQSVNPYDLIANHQLALAVSLDQNNQSQVILIPFDSNGNVTIDANNPILSSVFSNQNGHAVFTGAYAEVVQIDNQTPDLTNVNVLGTLVGSNTPSSMSETIQTVVHTTGEHVITHLEAPVNKSLPIEVAPVIPVTARSGLEDLNPNALADARYDDYYPYMLGSTITPLRPEVARHRAAPYAIELTDSPDTNIDNYLVARRYLNDLPHAYRREVERLSRDLARQPKAEKPRAVVIIPAAAHQEGLNIYQTLEQYAHQQNINPNDFEVVVFANYPRGSRRDITVSEVERFQQSSPGISVRLIERQLPLNQAKIGYVRKLATDAVIEDLIARNVDLNQVMLISNDADSQWIDPRYLRTIIDQAEAQPNTDAFLGFIDWSYDAYRAYPEILVGTRFMQMLEMYIRRSQNSIGSSGANFAFRPGIYMAVGGYRSVFDIVEDVHLGNMIKAARSGAGTRRPIAFLGRSSEVTTSARRAIDKLLRDGGAPIDQWEDGFGPNDRVRTQQLSLVPANLGDPNYARDLVPRVESFLNRTLDVYSRSFSSFNGSVGSGTISRFDSETLRQITRMLWVIGLQAKWQPDGTFRITSYDKMISNLKHWQAAH